MDLNKKASGLSRVLVVDDNRDAAAMLCLLIQMDGHEVHTAKDGLEGIEATREFCPDVVLMDLGMPRMNGFEAARHIRRQPWGENMLLVAISGWGQLKDRQRTQDAGFDLHLVKPVDFSELQTVLQLPARDHKAS